jgi:hypothetical protein
MAALTGLLPASAQPGASAPSVFDAFPVPAPSRNLLFYIQRNKNANAIVYEARTDEYGQLVTKDPVSVNWIRYTEGGRRASLNVLENNIAYGVRHKETKNGIAWMKFVASNDHPFRVEITGSGQAEARMMIGGHYARLEKAQVQAKEDGFWPKILHVDLFGTVVATGMKITERLYP